METKEVARGASNFKKDLLDSGDAYILDVGTTVFVWVGKGANKAEKREVIFIIIFYFYFIFGKL